MLIPIICGKLSNLFVNDFTNTNNQEREWFCKKNPPKEVLFLRKNNCLIGYHYHIINIKDLKRMCFNGILCKKSDYTQIHDSRMYQTCWLDNKLKNKTACYSS